MMANPVDKIISLSAALSWRQRLEHDKQTMAVTNGCFDIMHRGHAQYLYEAAQKADALLVLVNSDASVRAVKGEGRPILPESDRAYMLASLEAVTAVVVFDTENCTSQLRSLKPDVYVKGGDYRPETLVQDEYRLLQSMGCRVELIPPVPGVSTTEIISRIQAPKLGRYQSQY